MSDYRKHTRSYIDLARMIQRTMLDQQRLDEDRKTINEVQDRLLRASSETSTLKIWCPACINWNNGEPDCDYHQPDSIEPPEGMPCCFNSEE